jgi:UDP-2,4-diacetamido-2,4,6-trideoxy-beta-L-altropyranose hydrolase
MTTWAGFRADADFQSGTGHFMRCLALARAWKSHGGEADFLSATTVPALSQRLNDAGIGHYPIQSRYPSDDDMSVTGTWLKKHPGAWLIVDGYQFDSEYQRWAQSSGAHVMVIDDFVRLSDYRAEVLLDQNAGAEERIYPAEGTTIHLLGPEYAILAPEYGVSRSHRGDSKPDARKVLVTFGGSDPARQTIRVVRALRDHSTTAGLEVHVIVGPANDQITQIRQEVDDIPRFQMMSNPEDLASQMSWADAAVVSGGTTLWELACIGIPMVVIQIAENQKSGAEAIATAGAAVNLGWCERFSDSDVAEALDELLRDPKRRAAMSNGGRSLIDGKGADRVVETLMRISG